MSPVFTGLKPLFRSSSPLYGRAGLKWPIRPLLYGTGISQMRKKPRIWSMRKASKYSAILRMRAFHQPKPSSAIFSQL